MEARHEAEWSTPSDDTVAPIEGEPVNHKTGSNPTKRSGRTWGTVHPVLREFRCHSRFYANDAVGPPFVRSRLSWVLHGNGGRGPEAHDQSQSCDISPALNLTNRRRS